MKHLLLLFTALIILNGCSNDDDNASLPPETQTGANTVGCLVNGKVFLPHAEGLNPSVNCFYQFVDGEFFLRLDSQILDKVEANLFFYKQKELT